MLHEIDVYLDLTYNQRKELISKNRKSYIHVVQCSILANILKENLPTTK